MISKMYFGHETGHRGELRDDRPAFKSYAFGASFGKVWAPSAFRKQAKKEKNHEITNPPLPLPH